MSTLPDLVALESNWRVLGPLLPDPPTSEWPGELARRSLPYDRGDELSPEAMPGQDLKLVTAVSTQGILDFEKFFTVPTNGAVCYAETDITSDSRSDLLITYGADWGAVWWLNGQLLFDSMTGNGGPVGHCDWSFRAPLQPGRNRLRVKACGGAGGWTLKVMRSAAAIPPEPPQPRYSATGLRLECRPGPPTSDQLENVIRNEHIFAAAGVQSRWISVVDGIEWNGEGRFGNAFLQNDVLPMSKFYHPDFEQTIPAWIDAMKAQGMRVLSWFPLGHCSGASEQHPEWLQLFYTPQPDEFHKGIICCTNSGYGQAVIDFFCEILSRLELDGIWFDGTSFSPIWARPLAIGCRCPACEARFYAETGLPLPEKIDWQDEGFRRWIRWRYKVYEDYLTVLTTTLKEKAPDIDIVMNHYHRPGQEHWATAKPLRKSRLPIVLGTECGGDPLKAPFMGQLMRAYGDSPGEVWSPLGSAGLGLDNIHRQPVGPSLHCALGAITAGSSPSFGVLVHAGERADGLSRILTELSSEVNPRAAVTGGRSLARTALWISQENETFVWETDPRCLGKAHFDPYWDACMGWHRGLIHEGMQTDFLFDDAVVEDRLAGYDILIAPMCCLVSRRQRRALDQFTERGGVLVVDPFFDREDWADEAFSRLESDSVVDWTESPCGRGTVLRFQTEMGGRLLQGDGFREWSRAAERLRTLQPPLFSIESGKHWHAAAYARADGIYIHLHRYCDLAQPLTASLFFKSEPPPSPPVTLRWRGKPPTRACAMVPAPPYELEMDPDTNCTLVRLRGTRWGQVVRLEGISGEANRS